MNGNEELFIPRKMNGRLRKTMAMLLAIITFLTAIPLSNLYSASAGVKDRTFYFTLDPGNSDSYIADTWVFWDGDLTGIANSSGYDTVCRAAYQLIATWDTAHENYEESRDISWSGSGNSRTASGDFYNATPFLRIIIDRPTGYYLKSVKDANGSEMAYYYDGGDWVVAECGLYVGKWTDVGSGTPRANESISNITLEWACNHSGATETKYYDGANPDNCGYYHCTRCDATWGEFGHNWNSSYSNDGDTHAIHCNNHWSHYKNLGNHDYSKTEDNYKYYYKCKSCDASYSSDRTYTVKYYLMREDADGNWEKKKNADGTESVYWFWYSETKKYKETWSVTYEGDACYQTTTQTGTVEGDTGVFVKVPRKKYTLDFNMIYGTGNTKYCGSDISDLMTCDFYVNGNLVSSNQGDTYASLRYGSTYEFKNFNMKQGYAFADTGDLSGTITGDKEVVAYVYDNYAFALYEGNGANEGQDYFDAYSLRNSISNPYKLLSNIFTKYNYSFKGYDNNKSVGDKLSYSDNYSGIAAIKTCYNTSLVLNVAGDNNSNGANIHLWWDDSNNKSNYWKFIPTGDGYYYIVSSAYGKALDLQDGNAADFGNLQLWSLNWNTSQQWKLTPCGDGYYYISSRCNENYRLDVLGGSPAYNGQNIGVYHAIDYDGQKFKIDFLDRDELFKAQWEEATRLTAHGSIRFDEAVSEELENIELD